MNRTFAIGLAVFTVSTSPALAQNSDLPLGDEQGNRAMHGAPSGENEVFDPAPSVEFLVTQEKQTVTLSYSLISAENRRVDSENVTRASTTRLGMTASATLKEGQNDKSLLTLDGFSGGTTVGLHFSHSWNKLGSGKAVADEVDRQFAAAKLACNKRLESDARMSVADKALECSGDNGGQGYFTAIYNPSGFRDALGVQFLNPITPYFGFDFEGNQAKFDYLDRTSFSMKSTKKFSYEAQIYAGGVLRDRPMGARITMTLARKFEDADPVNLCQTTTVPGQIQCLEGADGAPTPTTQRTVGVQGYAAFGIDKQGNPRFGFAPSFSYDWHNDAFEIDAPLYLARDAQKRLSGGIRATYTDEPDPAGGRKTDFNIGLFIGVPLKWPL